MTVTDLANTATQYRKELKLVPFLKLEPVLQHMTIDPGVQYDKVLGSLSGSVELSNHNGDKNIQSGPTAGKRTLQTYVGDVILEEKPEDLRSTFVGQGLLGNNKNLGKHPLELQILTWVAGNVGKKLALAIFNGSRNSGTLNSTAAVFNGFDTIATTEISGSNISVANGNMVSVDPITQSNALDVLMSIWENASDELRSVATKMFVPFSVYSAYNRDYANTWGGNPYNTQFNKVYLEGTGQMCELVPMAGKAGSSVIQLTTKENMIVGFDAISDKDYMMVRPSDNPWKVQFAQKMNFGVQYDSIDKSVLLVAQIGS